MSKYTIELRKVIDLVGEENVIKFFTDYELSDYLTAKQIEEITKAGIWTKEKLARKIINHYFMNEIGFETIALFKHYAKVSMQEIMEEMLPLIYSASIEYDPLVNVDFTETFDRTLNGTSNATNKQESQQASTSISTSIANGNSVASDTPNSEILDINNPSYFSNSSASKNQNDITDNTDNSSLSNGTSTQNQENIEHYERTQKGNSGSLSTAQKLIEQYRKNIIAIDKQIIDRLNSLFMGIF